VSELELELKQGTRGALYRLALDLHAAVPFTIGAESKAQRGQRLRTGEAPQPVESDPPALDEDISLAETTRRIISAELGHFLANQPAAVVGDVKGVHQMRVGIRRLRTALAMCGKHLEPHAKRRFEAELKPLGQVFGAARDWDVFCT
jgi:triphosphatase